MFMDSLVLASFFSNFFKYIRTIITGITPNSIMNVNIPESTALLTLKTLIIFPLNKLDITGSPQQVKKSGPNPVKSLKGFCNIIKIAFP